MSKRKVFVTVGTTNFPKLIKAITTKKVIESLLDSGYDFVQLQTGNNFTDFQLHIELDMACEIRKENSSTIVNLGNKITLKYDIFFENFQQEISSSDLVISHAGAGTCLEVLRNKKNLIVVVNEDLMDNHQTELAEELQNGGYLYYCTCDNLDIVLRKKFNALKQYPLPTDYIFSQYLGKCVGFIE
ncbi:alg13 UDP-N-acetylglucosaminyltransferase subunit [Leptinotarsa decemlineata]|uniref:alg13 UDP-N-acetylglucosaminyltransferase subunit n=1 Tax=Leptinotarsa decemlineata TaxID=7539 RepID=UPI000C254118|nr:UDP-N-acetylglucosamine transferase subunit ALG13 homolog [Leptinotarsa decemlineata]